MILILLRKRYSEQPLSWILYKNQFWSLSEEKDNAKTLVRAVQAERTKQIILEDVLVCIISPRKKIEHFKLTCFHLILICIEILNKLVKDLIFRSQYVILGLLLIFPKCKQKFIRETVIKCYTLIKWKPTDRVNKLGLC